MNDSFQDQVVVPQLPIPPNKNYHWLKMLGVYFSIVVLCIILS